METLRVLQCIVVFCSTLALSVVDRKVLLLLVEIFAGIGGLVSCVFPRVFNDQNLEMLHLNKKDVAEPQMLFLMHTMGGLQLVLVLISFLSRTASGDQTVSRNVMTMWAQRLGLDVIVYMKLLSACGTVTKTVGGKTTETFDFNKIPAFQVCIFLVMLGLLVVAVVQLFRWPAFRAQICMATHDRTNFHLLLLEMYMFFFGCMRVAHTDFLKIIPGFSGPFDVNTSLLARTSGVVLLIVASYLHNAQSLYDSRDKAPLFQALIFGVLVMNVHGFVYLYELPGHFPLAFFVSVLVMTSFILANSVLGLLSALNGRASIAKSSLYESSQSYASTSEYTEEEEEETEGETVTTTEYSYQRKTVSFVEEDSSSQESGNRSPARGSAASGGDSSPERKSRRRKK